MNFYDIFVTYVMPYMIDLSLFPEAEKVFYYIFFSAMVIVVLSIFVYLPWKLCMWFSRGCPVRRKGGRRL